MKVPSANVLSNVLRKGRDALRGSQSTLRGRFQPYNHTLPNRYPWLFEFARDCLRDVPSVRLLSFGCSLGEEVFALRGYFPGAAIKGIDIDPRNVDHCVARAGAEKIVGVSFAVSATTEAEQAESYDAIFCLAVLCHGDLTSSGARRCDPLLQFEDFERVTKDFARCLKPGGLLLLHTTNFRFCDACAFKEFETLLEAQPAQLACDAIFDRDNRLMEGVRYFPVGFRKRGAAAIDMPHRAPTS